VDNDRLVQVGVALVSRFGARALSLTSVARHAGVARATAYRMFGGRDALVGAIVDYEIGLMREKIVEWSEAEPDVPARVHARVVNTLAYLREHQALQYVLRHEPEELVNTLVAAEDPDGPTILERAVDVVVADLKDDETAVLQPNPKAALELIARLVYSELLVPRSVMTDQQIADIVVRAVLPDSAPPETTLSS